MNEQHNYKDPYDSLPDFNKNIPAPPGVEVAHATAVRYSASDRAYVNGCHGGRPSIQITSAILFHRLVNELKRIGIGPEYDPAAYELAVGSVRIVVDAPVGYIAHPVGANLTVPAPTGESVVDRVQRSPASNDQPNRQAARRNDTGRTSKVARRVDAAHSVTTNPASTRPSTTRRAGVHKSASRR